MTTLEDYEMEVHESKGILDPEQEYTFQLVERTLREATIFVPDKVEMDQDTREMLNGKTFIEVKDNTAKESIADLISIVKEEWLQDRLNLKWKVVDEDLETVIYENWRVDKLTLNNNNPEYETRMVTFAKKTGIVVENGTKLKPNDIVKEGMLIKAHPERKKNSDYHQLNINTIKFAGVAPQHQKPLFTDISPEMQGKVLSQIEGAKTKEEAMQMLLNNKKSSLVGAMLAMIESGDLTFVEEKQ